MNDQPFLVAGGGIAGLAAALALSSRGAPVRLFEQAKSFEEVGAGLQMSPNGVRALRELGAWEAVEPSCVIPSEIHVRDGMSGALLQRIRLGKPFEERFGAPYRVCHRADLLAGLLTAARSVDLMPSAAITACPTAEVPSVKLIDALVPDVAALEALRPVFSSTDGRLRTVVRSPASRSARWHTR